MQIDELLTHFNGVKKQHGNDHYIALCPCHDDHKPSLDIKAGDKGVVMSCPVCEADGKAVMQKLGLDVRELFYEQRQLRTSKPPNVEYHYSDTLKKTRYHTWNAKKQRYEKSFCWYHWENGAWIKGTGNQQPPLYKQDNIRLAIEGNKTLYIVEGEKDVDTMTQKLKLPAVCSPHGAGNGKLGKKWRAEYNPLFAGANVAILADNDEAGKALANYIAAQLLPVAKSVKLPDLAFEWENLKPKGDITDIYEVQIPLKGKTIAETVTMKLEALTLTTAALTAEDLAAAQDEEPSEEPNGTPVWINDGTFNEQMYITDFIKQKQVRCINNKLYSVNGSINDGKARQLITLDILPYIKSNHGDKADKLLRSVKALCYMELPKPDTERLHFANGTLSKDENGQFTVFSKEKDFCLNRFPINYNPAAPRPNRFFGYLNDVYQNDDQITIQQYCGYCLLPTTILQKALIIIGEGGEGKSVLGAILNGVLGKENCYNESISTLQKAFGVANVEGKLLFIDDDLSENALTNARMFKNLVTNKNTISAEKKFVQDNQILSFVRFLCFGNFTLHALYDLSEGFQRRQLILQAKPKDPDRINNPFIEREILENEAESVMMWLIEGLNTLIQNNWQISVSERTQTVSDQIKREKDSVTLFLDECPDIVVESGKTVSSQTLSQTYDRYCDENLLPALAPNSFVSAVKSKGKSKGICYSNNIMINGRRMRGFKGIGVKR